MKTLKSHPIYLIFYGIFFYLSLLPVKLLPHSAFNPVDFVKDSVRSDIDTIDTKSLTLHPGWNWISFPRLDREGNGTYPADSVLMKIIPFPTSLQMAHRDPESQQFIYKTYDNINGWSGLLADVKSSLGYKLETNNTGVSVLQLTGTVLAPETTFPLFNLRSNWTGYYLTKTQSPFDAIAPEFLDKIDWMQGQYWYCQKESNHTKNSGYWWRCACSQGSVELKYADMIVIHPTENITNFHWQFEGQSSVVDPKNPSLLFQYHEQPEYDAIIIELDTMNRPEEIGAFAGDSCIGATQVLLTDTTVLICGYTQGFEGQEITFDLKYPTKSARPKCDDYFVLNNQTGIREKRRIVVGEKQPCFLVSLKQEAGNLQEQESTWVQCQPNPASNEVTVSYFLHKEANISFELTNTLGSVIMAWKRGLQNAGSYNLKFSTANLPSGCYQLRMSAGNSISLQKLIIIH